jgi:hypothetical protein
MNNNFPEKCAKFYSKKNCDLDEYINFSGAIDNKDKVGDDIIRKRSIDGNICYGGIGANESGTHTVKEFIKIMDDEWKESCGRAHSQKKCKDCVKYKKEIMEHLDKERIIRKNDKINTNNFSENDKKIILEEARNRNTDKYDSLLPLKNKCKKCADKYHEKCTLEQYIDFSYADKEECTDKLANENADTVKYMKKMFNNTSKTLIKKEKEFEKKINELENKPNKTKKEKLYILKNYSVL